MYKKRTKITLLIYLIFVFQIKAETQQKPTNFTITNTPKKFEKIKLLSILIEPQEEKKDTPIKKNEIKFQKISKQIKFDLEFTDQITCELKKSKTEINPQTEKRLFNKGYSLALYIQKPQKKSFIPIKLKDLSSNYTIFEGKFDTKSQEPTNLAHTISDKLLKILTNEDSIFLSSLAYCKTINKNHKIICISDYSCNKEKAVVNKKTISTAPCWHDYTGRLFYSQFTKSNIRLMTYNPSLNKHTIVSSYDGINMQPSISQDGKNVVMCLSGGKNSELYLYNQSVCKKLKKRVFLQLTKNQGNNSSPNLLPNGDIIFCSDFQTGSPQIYYFHRKSYTAKRLTSGRGYCASPYYCQNNNSIVYSRSVNGAFQLFTLKLDDLNNVSEKQITFNKGNKLEPSFSPNGKFIAFSYDFYDKKHNKNSQIAVLNTNSGKIRILTHDTTEKSFPRWTYKTLYL